MTFKELAQFILTLPEDIQDAEAAFANLDEDVMCVINGDNVKQILVTDKHIAPMLFGVPTAYYAIATSDDDIDDTYDHFTDF
jgi:hypothetical protein